MYFKGVNLPYVLLGIAYLAYYFTHLPEIYLALGAIYLFIAFKGH